MSLKEQLVLFFINGKPGIKSIYALVKHFDRANFPSEIDKSINTLLNENFICVTQYFKNGTPSEYSVTNEGKEYLQANFNKEQILAYIDTFSYPDLTRLYIERNI